MITLDAGFVINATCGPAFRVVEEKLEISRRREHGFIPDDEWLYPFNVPQSSPMVIYSLSRHDLFISYCLGDCQGPATSSVFGFIFLFATIRLTRDFPRSTCDESVCEADSRGMLGQTSIILPLLFSKETLEILPMACSLQMLRCLRVKNVSVEMVDLRQPPQ